MATDGVAEPRQARVARRARPSVDTLPPAVVARGLIKRFGAKVAVAGIDLEVPQGSFHALVGRNGAGKTTFLKMVTGLLRPDAGSAAVDGVDVWRDPAVAKARIGILPEDPRSFDRLSGAELLAYHGMLRGMDPTVIRARSGELLEVFELGTAGRTPVLDYSQGMRKKIGLACALLHAPRVLFLDEPFESVDPVSARVITDVLRRYCASSGTVVLSSHVMDTVERLCDRVGIVHDGRLVALGTVAEVRNNESLEDRFMELVGVGAAASASGLDWLAASAAPPTPRDE